ncbi:Zn-dependent hydrolase of the beta-lactamase fold-like protein protein [Thermoanaerobacterium thermosaccharolyticum DSM 571]|uniref:Zn-dependent hydrolase of the beta-lactamase fold-like protein protein n=1 Tax=Thermoanaerobacterium thermosaccharolyticum (strain ATCC 7956 / DSM 571 / NCIMB 9385 / NCA 3814 / NCTC 13789 / WDCM 00135 / 2032) TaxID=580327 RepID=D9TPL5_THETC|nr:MBL fold metallo-hydrolase [Thermoanaerobacterium thermosaccharolyticum]ADL67797.1 Zn-dependent hydrolase of the beta-lactamase fold-like protein protein [Thermoanaerobacterium thermosaccharolyticum DSM 571]
MKIRYFGHSCFKITLDSGIRIVTDPFDQTVGYPLPDTEADIVTSSHSHFDHNYFKAVRGDFKIVNTPGQHDIDGVHIKGISTFHDDEHGAKRGKNIVFVINADNIKVCHAGDLGHILTDDMLKEIGDIDVLMIPVGGYYTIDDRQAVKVIEQLKPKLTIAMHYRTSNVNLPIETVDNFLRMAGGQKIQSNEIEIKKDDLEGKSEVIALNYK